MVHACVTKILGSALKIGDPKFLQFLTNLGINISPLYGVYGGRFLCDPAKNGKIAIAQILLENSAEVNNSITLNLSIF